MIDKKSGFNVALKSNIGKLMFASIPLMILLFSLVFFVQALVFSIWEIRKSGHLPALISLIVSIFYFGNYFFIRKKSVKIYHSLYIFIWLFLFFFIELLILAVFNIPNLWVFLILTQILSGYFLLDNRYFFTMMIIIVISYLFNMIFIQTDRFRSDSLTIESFVLLISYLIHSDRRKNLFNLESLYSGQREINNRFTQLEKIISQVFIICSTDFSEFYHISSGFDRMFSISKAKVTEYPYGWQRYIHPGDLERVNLEFESAAKELTYREFDFRTLYKNTIKWLRIKIFPVEIKKNDEKNRYIIVIDNVTEQKNAELKLAEAKSIEGDIAARIQKNLLFSSTELNIEKLDVAAVSIPSLSVGGDFFDFYRFSDQILDVIIADVMGKGMIASMLGAASKNAFMKARLDLTVTENKIPVIEHIMFSVNKMLTPELIKMGKFITLQYGRMEMDSSTFSFIDCGHTSLLYYNARQKTCWSIKGWNMPMGFNPDEIYIKNIVPFESNDLFFFYSDGITEVENEEGEQFGERRLNYILNNSFHLTANQIVSKVKNLVFHYSSSSGFADDVTCIALKSGEIEDEYFIKERIFSGERESLDDVRSFTAFFLKEHCAQLDKDEIDSIIIAINEATANIIEHNYEKDEKLYKQEFFIEAGKNESICYFRLYYDGVEFDWTQIESPRLSELKDGGYGLYLMKEIMDSICYSKNIDGVQSISLVKFI